MGGVLSPKTQMNLKNAKSYFAEHLSVGDYYGENASVRGEWLGEGAVKLGLTGAVQQKQFLALCENQDPRTGKRLTQKQNANRRVFYDFTFSPPKSVSVAALVIADGRIVTAHAAAVKVALAELEQFAATRLRRQDSNKDRITRNIAAALFQHETSRALDPHLHTHCIAFNATHDDTEGCWKALQNYEMLGAQKYAENVYYHELARSLREFGYTIDNSRRGDFEIGEVTPEIRARFSKRHREIDEKTRAFLEIHPEKHSGNEKAIREHIAHKERARKNHELDARKLRSHWKSELSAEELDSLRLPKGTNETARDGMGVHSPLAPRLDPEDGQLSPEQSRALDSILWSTNFITLFRGAAGTGKSFVLKRVQQELDTAKCPSVVLAPQRQQVIDLNRIGLTHTQTVAECLQRQELPDRSIVIVDEAGQLSGRQMFDLIRLVKERGGRLILSGDTRQHGPVEASDALRAIERYSGVQAAEVSDIRRQNEQRGRTMAERKRIKIYREAVKAAAAGDLSGSFRKLEALGSIIECDPATRSERLAGAYLEIVASGESAIVVSQTRAEVRAVNDAIRKHLRSRAVLTGDETRLPRWSRLI